MTPAATTWTKLLDVLFEDTLVGRCLVAPDGTILRANSEWLRSTGFSRDVVGEDLIALFPDVRDMSLALHARARAGHHVAVPRHAQSVNGRETWWEGSLDPVPMEGGTAILVTTREVTDAVLRTARDLTSSVPGTPDAPGAATRRLAQDLDAMTRLHRLSTGFVRGDDLPHVFEEIVDVAIAITHADMGNIQILDPASRRLRIAAYRGHERWWLDYFESVAEGGGASCGAALHQRTRAIVEDVTRSPIFVGTPGLEVQLRAGIRAVQSTPLVASSGALVGMLSTHYRTVRRPDERDLWLLDLLARQAADLIERVRSEAAQRENEEMLRMFVEHAPAAVAMFDRDMRYLVVSRRFLSDYRRSSGELIGRSHYEVFPEIPERWKEIHRRCLAGAVESCEEEPFPRADGSLDWVRWEIRPWHTAAGTIGGIILFSELITPRKHAQEALRRSEERLRLAQEVARVGTFEWDLGSSVNTWTPELEAMYGLRRGGFPRTQAAWESLVHPQDRAQAIRRIEQSFETGEATEGEWRVVWPDGSVHWLTGRWQVFKDGSGKPLRVTGMNIDITARKAAESRLAYLASFPEKNPNPVVEATPDCRVTYASPSALRLFPDIRQREAAHPWLSGWEGVALSIRDGGPVGERVVNVGDRYFFQVIIQLPGPVVRIYGTDITERVRAEQALRAKEAELEAILERTPFMLTRCSRDLRYLYVSRAYAEMIGRTPEEVAGRPIVEIMGDVGFATIRSHVETVLRGRPAQYETAVNFAGVGDRLLRAVYMPDTDHEGRVIGWIASVLDLTEQRHAEDALQVANDRLVESDRRKTEFLAMLSHELRNPLAPIRNSLSILGRAEPTGQEARRAKEVIERQVGHLTRLVDDLLDVTRITRGRIELRLAELDLAALVRRTAEDYRRMMQDRGLALAIDVGGGGLVVDGDETRLAQVFGNLLSNAAKFTPAGGRVTITALAEAGRAVVRVRDTGPGVAPDVLPSVFEPFMQAKQTLARTEGGLGLGLALVREFVSLHGGDVNVVSGRGGAEFIVRLPLAAPREHRVAPAGGPAKPAVPVPRRRVLVVDDNEDAAETLAELVRMLEHEVEIAHDGATAVRRAGEYHPDLVLCDIGLPGMDGYEVARALRAAGIAAQLFAISGYAQPEDVKSAVEAGFDGHLAKPCDPDQIERLLS